MELVDDNVLKVTVYIDVRESRVHDSPGLMVQVVDKVGSFLDFYGFWTFRHYDLGVRAFRAMVEAQKDKDRKRPPNRS